MFAFGRNVALLKNSLTLIIHNPRANLADKIKKFYEVVHNLLKSFSDIASNYQMERLILTSQQ